MLLALGVIADFHDVPLATGIRMDAGMALALITLAVLGPLPALCVDLVPMTVGALVRREPLARAGNLANVAAYGWKALAAAGILALGAPGRPAGRCPALAAARRRHAAARQLGGRPGHLWHAVARAPVLRDGADAGGHRPGVRDRAHARGVHQRADRPAGPVRTRRVRRDRRAAADRAHLRGPHAPGRAARPGDGDAPLRARARLAPWPAAQRAPAPRPRDPAGHRPPHRRGRSHRLRPQHAARPEPRLLGGRPRRRVVERRRRPGRPARRRSRP